MKNQPLRIETNIEKLFVVPFFLALVLFCDSCVRFQPKTVSATNAADDFDARSLSDIGLREFLSVNNAASDWPRESWNLDALTLAALYYHPDVDVARAKWRGASAAIATAGERPNPSVSLTPTYDTTTPPPWILGLSFDIPVETAGKRGHRITQAKRLSEAARLNLAATAWQVRSRVRRSLLELYTARETEVALKQQTEALANVVGLLEKQVQAGAASPVELTQARINVSTTRLALQDAQRQNAESRVALADAAGLPARALEEVTISFDGLNQLPTALMEAEVRRQAALNRTDVRSALAEYAASQAALQLEISRQYPDLHIGPGYQLDQKDNKWTLGATLTLPILNQNQGAIGEAMAHREEAAARFTAIQAKVFGEIDRAVVGYKAAREQVQTTESLLSELKKRQDTTKAMFEAGEADALTVAAAQAEFSTAALTRLNSLTKAQQSLAALEDAVQSPLLANPARLWEENPRLSQGGSSTGN